MAWCKCHISIIIIISKNVRLQLEGAGGGGGGGAVMKKKGGVGGSGEVKSPGVKCPLKGVRLYLNSPLRNRLQNNKTDSGSARLPPPEHGDRKPPDRKL